MYHMKTWISHIFVSLLVISLTACSGESEPKVEPSVSISGQSSATIGSIGGSTTITFSSAKDWTASSSQSWCKISPSSGKGGNATITITVDENTSYDERNASVTISSETISKNITVTQKQKDALTLTSNKVEVKAEGSKIEIEVKSNIAFETQIETKAQEWISPVSRGLSTSILAFQIQPNKEFEKREGKITIIGNNLSETVTVYQEGISSAIVLSQNEYIIGSTGETITIQVKSDLNYEMKMPEADWIQISESRAVSTYTHYLTILPNDTYDSRSAVVSFVGSNNSVTETVTINQLQKNAIIVANNEYKLDARTTELEFPINTNVEFEVTTPEWIKRNTESRALESIPLRFTVEENSTLDVREGIIVISGEDVKQEIKVIQLGRNDSGRVAIIHNGINFNIPQIVGHNVSGTIYWGDNTQENYKENTVHTYQDDKEYQVIMEILGGEEIIIPKTNNLIEIDLTEF